MKIFNTLSRRKEEFVPIEPGKVKMYVCGPTVYNFIHIGNARPMIVFDTVRRYFEYKGYEVNYVSNFTDVDDKIIRKAIEEGVDAETISKRYIAECKKDMEMMNVKPATKNPQATQEIGGMIEMINTLIEKGHAYVAADGTVYFRTKSFKEYGKLSHKNLDDLQSGFREIKVTGEEGKEDPTDFVLWKPKKEGEPFWESPWCQGRPGWHIECSEMSKKYLGESIDIHAGGEDLIFPHHENEIAQSECCTGKEYAHYWMHNGYINVDNKKMSKSLGNFFTVREVAEKYGYDIDLIANPSDRKTADSLNKSLGYEQEYKVSKTPTKSSIDRLLRTGKDQSDNIVLSIESDISLSDIASAFRDRVRRAENIKRITLILWNEQKDITLTREEVLTPHFKIRPEDFR